MNCKQKVSCKGCHKLILVSTATKYQGYSRQCLAKKELAKPKLAYQQEPSQEDISYYLQKTNLHFPKLYYYKEFVRIWALTGSPDIARKYYLKYLENLEQIVFALTDIREHERLIFKPYAEVVTAFGRF